MVSRSSRKAAETRGRVHSLERSMRSCSSTICFRGQVTVNPTSPGVMPPPGLGRTTRHPEFGDKQCMVGPYCEASVCMNNNVLQVHLALKQHVDLSSTAILIARKVSPGILEDGLRGHSCDPLLQAVMQEDVKVGAALTDSESPIFFTVPLRHFIGIHPTDQRKVDDTCGDRSRQIRSPRLGRRPWSPPCGSEESEERLFQSP